MARARNIKPGFFKNELLAEMPTETRLLFIGLWTLSDREGRLEDRPRRIKAELFPFDSFDVDPMLTRLQADGFLVRYNIDGKLYVQLENFVKHQDPHYREKASEIPPPPGKENQIKAVNVTRSQRRRILERDSYTCQACKSTEQLCVDHIMPISRGGQSDDENLQILCLSCNTKKSNKVNVGSTLTDEAKASLRLVPLTPDSLTPESLSSDSKTKPRASHLAVMPEGMDSKVWEDFCAIRRAKRAPLTATALDGISREAGTAGISLESALRMCCERGWQGFKADWAGAQGQDMASMVASLRD